MTWQLELFHGVEGMAISLVIACIVIKAMLSFKPWFSEKVIYRVACSVYWLLAAPLMLHIMLPPVVAPSQISVRSATVLTAPAQASPATSRPIVLYSPNYKGPDVDGVPQHR